MDIFFVVYIMCVNFQFGGTTCINYLYLSVYFRDLYSQMFPNRLFFLLFYPCSGKIIRRFVPMDKILKPVLLECVTPVTCYWSLSFIVRGEAELVLVFKVHNSFY